MEFRVYLGPFETATDHIYSQLVRNQNVLEAEGIYVVPRGRCNIIWQLLLDYEETQKPRTEFLQDFISCCLEECETPDIQQIVIFQPGVSDGILGTLRGADILPRVRFITRIYLKCIPPDNLMMTAAVRAPSSYIPALYARRLKRGDLLRFEEFLFDIKPEEMIWSDTWSRLILPFTNLHPDDAPLYVWRHEDYPDNWREVLSTITGHQNPDMFSKSEDTIETDISLYGAALYAHYIETQQIENIHERREAFKLFASDYPDDGTIIKDDYWTPKLIETLNDAYADDWYFLEQMDHVVTI